MITEQKQKYLQDMQQKTDEELERNATLITAFRDYSTKKGSRDTSFDDKVQCFY